MKLAPQSRDILQAISKGRSYEQILLANPDLTYGDIFAAAAEALAALDCAVPGPTVASEAKPAKSYEERMAEIHEKHPRAYEPWEEEEDADLTRFFKAGMTVMIIAHKLQRQPGAIGSRLKKLGLLPKNP
jgi:hypothetical protein